KRTGSAHRFIEHRGQDPTVQHTRESLVALRRLVVRDDAPAVSPESQFEPGFVTVAAGEAALVCGFIIEFVGVLHGRDQFISRSGRNLHVDRRSEAIAQLLETALAERFATPVIELLQAMPIPLAVDEAGDLRALAVNELMARVLQRADAAGLTISSLLPPAHPLSDPRPFRSVATSGQPFAAAVIIDGQTWEWFIRPLKGRGRAVEYFLTGLVASPAAPLDLDVARLRDMNAAKTEFLNMAAHELRTPLSVILGYGSLLAQGGLSEEHQKLAGARIYEKTRQLSRLIMDMSLVGRFDELGSSMSRQAIDLVDLLEDILKDQQRRFADLAIEFEFEALRAPVRGNGYWLRLAIRE